MSRARALALAFAMYVAWMLATFVLEGHRGLLLRFDPEGRALYALVANVLIGTIAASWVLRLAMRSEIVHADAIGLVPRRRIVTLGGTVLASIALLLLLTPARTRHPIVLFNMFSQVLPTSIAEIVVCFMLLGGVTMGATRSLGRAWSILLALVVGDFAFAVYHVAHSPPFDQPAMMAFLAVPGLVTGAMLFVGRDLFAALLVQNVFAVVGMSRNVDTNVFQNPFVGVYVQAVLALVVLAVAMRTARHFVLSPSKEEHRNRTSLTGDAPPHR